MDFDNVWMIESGGYLCLHLKLLPQDLVSAGLEHLDRALHLDVDFKALIDDPDTTFTKNGGDLQLPIISPSRGRDDVPDTPVLRRLSP